MSKYKNKIFSKISILSLTIIISIFVGSVLLFKTIQNEDNTNLLYQEVIDNKGSYNPNKLVLKNTTKEIAEDIAKRLNSKLRITSGGEFATITLKEDITIESIVSNPENKDILEYLSLDYRSSISQLEEEIEEIIDSDKLSELTAENDKIGISENHPEYLYEYADFIINNFKDIKIPENFKVALDTANGATYKIAEYVFKMLGINYGVINNNPNGININEKCGSTHLEDLKEYVVKNKFSLRNSI